jgi:putative tricarboxylic transport membrane protein
LLRKLEYPMAPAVLAIVLGPLAESSMRQSLLINHGNPMIFFERPISGPIMLTAMLLFLVPAIQAVRRRLRRRRQAAPRA